VRLNGYGRRARIAPSVYEVQLRLHLARPASR
jgi:hypothetical protein